ncbi:integrase [Mycobacteroides chelonae]|uniref:integrase n=1 Tax=Mycobacteroides chelonae TaxID=1774 RepID=UPI0012FF7EE0|nr:integrase [Mycobacteroides chelonae]
MCESAGLKLATGATRPRYDDDIWDLSGLADTARQNKPYSRVWDFTAIIDVRWRFVAKDIALAFLAPGDPHVVCLPSAFRTPRHPSTVHLYLRQWTRWLNWLTNNGVRSLGDVTAEHCDAYLAHSSWSRPRQGSPSRPLEPNTVKNIVKAVQSIAFYGGLFRHDRYPREFIPWGGRPAYRVAGYAANGENTTQPVPDELLSPLLANALYHVEVIGPHVADLLETVRNDPLRWNTQTRPQVQRLDDNLIAAFKAVVGTYVVSGRPLPQLDRRYVQERVARGWDTADPLLHVHISRLLREADLRAGLNMGTELPQPVRSLLEEAIPKVGLAGVWGRDAALVDHATTGEKIPWTLPLDVTEVHRTVSYTLAAAAIVTAALTGMRNSELMEISSGSGRVSEIAPGRNRYHVASKLVKGQPLGGVDDEWVVVEEVYRAITLAERLTLAKSGDPLFGSAALKPQVDNFRQWCSEPLAQRLGLAEIPHGSINGRMLRRTLSIELATRPNGLLAAKFHLKQASVVTTEGYAARPGGSQAVFRAEVEREERKHHLQLTRAAFEQYQAGTMPTGPGARDLIAAFKHVDAQLHSTTGAPAVLDNDRRIENLLRQRAATLHVGVANFCWFSDPSKALCLRLAGVKNADRPIVGMCDSSRCPQATHHEEHRAVWVDAAHTVNAFLGNPRVTKVEKRRLQVEYDRSMRVIDAIDAVAPLNRESD